MSRLTVVAAGVLGLAAFTALPAGAATSPAPAAVTTTTCGTSGLQSGLYTKVCAEITGDSVQLYGQISLAGPPSPVGPGSGWPPAPALITKLTGDIVGGASLGVVNQNLYFDNQTTLIRGVGGTVPCGSVVHATFTVASYPWSPVPVTLDVPIAC